MIVYLCCVPVFLKTKIKNELLTKFSVEQTVVALQIGVIKHGCCERESYVHTLNNRILTQNF